MTPRVVISSPIIPGRSYVPQSNKSRHSQSNSSCPGLCHKFESHLFPQGVLFDSVSVVC